MQKKLPKRMCVACRAMKEKVELLRIVKASSGEVSIDFTNKKPGRGAYVCNDLNCINKCVKSKGLNRAFKCEISKEIYEKLCEDFSGTKQG